MDSRLCKIAFLGLAGCVIATAAPLPDTALAQDTPDIQAEESGIVAELRALNKVTARTTDLKIPVGGSERFGTLTIRVDYCRTRPPIEPPESFVLLTVRDRPPEREVVEVFDGWMLASMPSLNPFEHPVYDIWATGCQMPEEAAKE